MEFKVIEDKLNEKNVSRIKLVTREGDETLVSTNDTLEDKGKYLSIKRDNQEEILLVLDDIYKIDVGDDVKTPPIRAFKRQGLRNRY